MCKKKEKYCQKEVMGWASTNDLDTKSEIFLKCRLWYVLSQLSKSMTNDVYWCTKYYNTLKLIHALQFTKYKEEGI